MSNLQRYENNGLELIIDDFTGEVFATQGMIAKLCKQESSTVRQFLEKKNGNKTAKHLPIKDSRGVIQLSKIYDEDAIYEAFAKYKPELLIQFAKVGIRVYLYKLGGINLTTKDFVSKDNLSVQLIMSSLNELHSKIDKQENEIKAMQPFCERLSKIDMVLDSYSGLKEALDYLVANYNKSEAEFTLGEWLEEKNKGFLTKGDRIKIGRMVSDWVKISCKKEIKTNNTKHKLYCTAFEPLLSLALDYIVKS